MRNLNTKICPSCRSTYEVGDFCPKCYVQLISVDDYEEQQQQSKRKKIKADTPVKDPNTTPISTATPTPPPKGFNFKLLIPILIAAIVVIIILLVSLRSPSGSDPCKKGHDWADATCTEAKHCLTCGTTEGSPLGHDLIPATTDSDGYCSRCGMVLESALESGPEIVDISTITNLVSTSQPSETFNCYTVDPANASATSVKSQNNDPDPHSASKAIDGLDETSWQEGVSGDGIGESISFDLYQEEYVKALSLKLGNWRNDEQYYSNGRPDSLTIDVGEYSCYCTFDDIKQVYWVTFSSPIPASTIKLTLEGAYSGNQSWDDTCIAEVQIWAE